MKADEWLRSAIVEGLKGLMVLRLEGAPAEDLSEQTANAWIFVIANQPMSWDEERDRLRIVRAFITLASKVERWPAPKQFLDCLPAKPERLKLTAPTSREIPAAAKAFLAKFLKKKERTGDSGAGALDG